MKIRSSQAGGVIAILILFITLLNGCFLRSKPPDVRSVEEQIQENYSDIQSIVRFMIERGYDDVYISDTNGTMLSDLTRVTIADEAVYTAITKLISSGEYIHFSKIGNTIRILQWRGMQDIGCGIAYSINRIELPKVQYVTELVPLNEDGWYYYVADYNSWRNGKRATLPEDFNAKHPLAWYWLTLVVDFGCKVTFPKCAQN
jgi:hypothetical protein